MNRREIMAAGRLSSPEQIADAKIDFEAIDGLSVANFGLDWQQRFGTNTRFAVAVLARSKPELIDAFTKDGDAMTELMTTLQEFSKEIKAVRRAIDAASSRLLIAGSEALAS